MPEIYLVRHAKAGSRREWTGPDRARPLTEKGRRQAKAIAKMLADRGVARVFTSEYTRCWETVAPLARELDLLVEEAPALREGAHASESVAFLESVFDRTTVLCSHGDVLGDLVTYVAAAGIDIGDDPRLDKGSTWVLDVAGGEVVAARYLPPPAV